MMISAIGNGINRGRSYGEQLIDVLPQVWNAWCHHFENQGYDSGELATLLSESPAWNTCRKLLPDFVDELENMALHAKVSWTQVAALSMLDESWALTGGMACTAVAITRNNLRVAGQNMDLPLWTDGFQTILRARDVNDVSVVCATYPGSLATCAVNNRGVVVIVNALDLKTDLSGIPVDFVTRAAAHQPTARDAIDLIHELPHAVGQTYTVMDDTDLFMVEADAQGVISVPTHDTVSWHTNHALTRKHDVSESSLTRWNAALHNQDKLTSREALQEFLLNKSSGVCQVPGRFTQDMYSFMGIVGDSNSRQVWVNVSPATDGSFREVTFI